MPKLRLLYLDADYYVALSRKELAGVEMELIPEVSVPPETSWMVDAWPEGIIVDHDGALDTSGDHMCVYEPTPDLLGKIREITESGGIDLVVIGNNRGAGVKKAEYVVPSLRDRTIVTANSWPPRGRYEPLGYTLFASRLQLHVVLKELVQTLVELS